MIVIGRRFMLQKMEICFLPRGYGYLVVKTWVPRPIIIMVFKVRPLDNTDPLGCHRESAFAESWQLLSSLLAGRLQRQPRFLWITGPEGTSAQYLRCPGFEVSDQKPQILGTWTLSG